jgi:type IV secretion system protein VirB4
MWRVHSGPSVSAQTTNVKKPPHSGGSAKRERDLEAYREIADDVIESDFVPYACLCDKDTLATKNGEVLQIIKVTGLGFDAQGQGDLRAAIRAAIRQCIPDTSYAIWLHTLRRHQSLLAESHFSDGFSARLDAAWRSQHPASASFVNELYITIVKAAQPAALSNLQVLAQSLWPPRDREMRLQYLERALAEITATTQKIVHALAPFGARLLTTVEREGAFYGEHLEFLEKLINLKSRPMPIPRRDLSQVLTSGEITFGYNAMEVRTADNHRRFACILTLKEYKESTLAGIDKFLEIPCELIITQCFDFVGAEFARAAYETQQRYLSISGDTELARWVEIDRLTGGAGTAKSFGEQQTGIFLIAPSVKQLEHNVRMAQKALSRLGMVIVREDLRLEDCYWAQLPANFPFIVRKHSVDTEHLAGFANLQRQPMGSAAGSPWGPPVALLPTVQDTPYFFNFHRAMDEALPAHTLVLGEAGSGRTTLTHFLIAQARRLPLRIHYLDLHGRGGPLLKAMGGDYATPGTASLRLNPLALEANPANRDFLALWLTTLIDPEARQLNKTTLAFFQSLMDAVFRLPPAQRRLSALIPLMREQDAALAAAFSRWTAGGEHGELFDMPVDQFAAGALSGWNLKPWADKPELLLPLVGYLLHRLTLALDGKPTLLVLDEGFSLLRSPLFGPRAGAWFDYLTGQNAAALINVSDVAAAAALPFAPALAARAASIFALPTAEPGAEYAMGFGFNEGDYATLAYMKPARREVLLKRGGEATVLKMGLDTLDVSMRLALSGRTLPPEKSPAESLSELMGYGTVTGVTA